MKRKILAVLCLVMLLFGLAGPRPVEAQSGCVEYSSFINTASWKYIDFGSAYSAHGDYYNAGDFNGKYYYFHVNGSWTQSYTSTAGGIMYDGSTQTAITGGQITSTTTEVTFYMNHSESGTWDNFRLCNSDQAATNTPTSTSTATSTPTVTATGPTPTQTATPPPNQFYFVQGEVLNASTDFDSTPRTYSLSNDFACGSGDILVAQNLAFGVWGVSGQADWYTDPGYTNSHSLFSDPGSYGEIYSQLDNEQDTHGATLDGTFYSKADLQTEATTKGLDMMTGYNAWYGNRSGVLPSYSSVVNSCANSGACGSTQAATVKASVKLLCFGNNAPPPPTYGVCKNTGIYKTIDVLTQGTLTDGTLTAQNIAPGDPNNGVYATDKIDFTYTLDLPANVMDGYKGGWLAIDMGGNYGPNFPNDANPGLGSHLSFTVNINDSEYTIQDVTGVDPSAFNDTNKLGLTGGTTHLTIHVESTYANQYTNRVNYYALSVVNLRLKILLGNACLFNTLNDGGMEWYPGSPYWGLSDPSKYFGRRNSISYWDGTTQGFPACGNGWQAVSSFEGAIEEPFTWNGGTAYWKVKYRSGKAVFIQTGTILDMFNVNHGVPSVYLSNSSGNIIDLVGDGHYDLALSKAVPGYSNMSGSISLPAGDYKIHLERACDFNGGSACNGDPLMSVLFDDISVGYLPQDGTCDEIIYDWPDNVPTPTPTPTAPTPTGTRATGTITPDATMELTGTPTGTVSATWVKTEINQTETARATATNQLTPTPITYTPTKSSTPWGNGNTQTPNPGRLTATAQGTPQPTSNGTMDPDMPPIVDPNGTPIPGMDPLQPGPLVECIRPPNWYDIAWWIDYERCVLFAFVSFGPSQMATAQSIPTLFASKEPFYTIGQARNAVVGMQTEIATMQWGNTGMNGVQAPVSADNPTTILKPLNPGQVDPWSGIGKFTINLGTRNPALVTYCSNQLSGFFSKYLGDGMCYALNLMMAIGYLPWIQMIINLLCIWGIIKQGLSVIGYGMIGYGVLGMGGSKDGGKK